jgi:hypothetical protein
MSRAQGGYLGAAGLLLVIEILIARFAHDAVLRPYGGDVLATIFVYCLLSSVLRGTPARRLLLALLLSYLVELGQYLRLTQWLGLADYPLAVVVLGSRFSWADMAAYTLGAGLTWVVERRRRHL